jgi:hypothetical protein
MHTSTKLPGRLTWSMALLLSVMATGCGGGSQDTILGAGSVGLLAAPPGAIVPGAFCAAANGPTIPTVTASDPTNGNQAVSTGTSGAAGGGKLINATFSLAMNAASINATSFQLAPAGGSPLVPASVNYNAATKVATLATSSALLTNTSYTAVIRNTVTSSTGTPLGCSYSWTFKTATTAVVAPAAVNLGLATPFGIAAAAGVTNTATAPTSRVNGDAVLNPTATCNAVAVPGGSGTAGFGLCGGSPPSISGSVVTPVSPDTTTANAVMADLRSAYNSLMPANLPGATVLGCGAIGTGGGGGALIGCSGNATLPPGVYISSTGSTIGVTGVLTLDGQGDANARFVFQAPSALTTADGAPGLPGSRIVLTNGARASNVFWQVGSSATIGTYSDFQGNVLADSSITMRTSSTSCGRLLAGAVTTSGAFVFDTSTVSVPGNASAPAGCL